jgi:flagellar FliJ protein
MATFKFRLQPLVQLREADRDRCREQLAAAYRAEQILVERAAALRQELKTTEQVSRTRSQPGRIEVDTLLHTHRYELILAAQLRQLASQQQKVAQEIERRRLLLVEADRELRMLEKLRERHAQEFQREEERRLTRELDEIAQRRPSALSGGNAP